MGAAGPPTGSTTAPIRVVVVDSQQLFRRGLAMLLGSAAGITVVGEASDGPSALVMAAERLPDVVLLDIRMPQRSGIIACAQLVEASPRTRVVMLAVSADEADLSDAFRAGASGYLLKDVSVDEVAATVRAVAAGQPRPGQPTAEQPLTEIPAELTAADPSAGNATAAGTAPRLTVRELEVLRLVADGSNNREIARALFISENTVRNHVRNILDKLQLHSRMAAVVYALREHLLDLP